MAEYTPEFLAYAKHRVEETDDLMEQIAVDCGIGKSTLLRIGKREGWTLRGQRPPRGLPARTRLHDEVAALSAARVSEEAGPPPPASPSLSRVEPEVAGEAERAALPDTADSGTADNAVASSPLPAFACALEQMERLVQQQITAVQTEEERLDREPRGRVAAERTARTLATLTQTLRMLAGLRGEDTGSENDYDDDMPRDIDEFRRDLARRIDAFVESRTQPGHADGNSEHKAVDEVR